MVDVAARTGLVWDAERITEAEALCKSCGTEGVPSFFHSITAGSPLLELTPREIGLPAFDILWARRGFESVGLELSGDHPHGAS